MAAKDRIRLGTRRSPLALAQARLAAQALEAAAPGLGVEIVPVVTEGDRDRRTRLDRFSRPGVFTRAVEQVLAEGRIDAAVHSAKDLPSELDPAFRLAGVLPREDVHDALAARGTVFFASLPEGALVGSSSPRRTAQLKRLRSDLSFTAVRGNIETRLKKLDRGDVDALVLATAGLKRLGLEERISEILPFDVCLPAAGQGAIVMESLDRGPWSEILERVGSSAASLRLEAERSFLRRLGAGCSAAVAALTRLDGEETLTIEGRVLDEEGRKMVEGKATVPLPSAAAAGVRLAEDLLSRGAAELLGRAEDPSRSKEGG